MLHTNDLLSVTEMTLYTENRLVANIYLAIQRREWHRRPESQGFENNSEGGEHQLGAQCRQVHPSADILWSQATDASQSLRQPHYEPPIKWVQGKESGEGDAYIASASMHPCI